MNEEVFCSICGELIVNPVNYKKIVKECYSYIAKNYGFFEAIEWLNLLSKKIGKLMKKFGFLTFCPYCLVELMKECLEEVIGIKDGILEKWLKSFEGLF